MTEVSGRGMILARVPRLDALRHKRLPLKFPPKLDGIIRIPRKYVNRFGRYAAVPHRAQEEGESR